MALAFRHYTLWVSETNTSSFSYFLNSTIYSIVCQQLLFRKKRRFIEKPVFFCISAFPAEKRAKDSQSPRMIPLRIPYGLQ